VASGVEECEELVVISADTTLLVLDFNASRAFLISFMLFFRFLGYFWYKFFCLEDHRILPFAVLMITSGFAVPNRTSSSDVRRWVKIEASGKISRTHVTAVLISCAPPSHNRLYVTVSLGVGLGRALFVAVFDSHVLLEAVSIVRFRSMLQFMVVLLVACFCLYLFFHYYVMKILVMAVADLWFHFWISISRLSVSKKCCSRIDNNNMKVFCGCSIDNTIIIMCVDNERIGSMKLKW